MEKNYKLPAICWLKMTDYMHGWLESELGGEVRAHGLRVLSVQHLEGARAVLRMETTEDVMAPEVVERSMSGTRMNCISAGMIIDADVVKELYGLTKETIALFEPIECPKMCLTRNGVLRPWTLDTTFGRGQAIALQRLLRGAFWEGVAEFDRRYAEEQGGEWYAAKEMVEEFCAATGTPDVHVEAIRREWQRRRKRQD